MQDDGTRTGNQLVSFYSEVTSKANSLGVELLPMEQGRQFNVQGPAVAGIVYVRHPIDERELIAFANYDERLAQDRYEEALRVFTSLGAARIVAASHRQTTKQLGGRFAILGKGGSVSIAKDASWSLTFDQEGDGGAPMDPRPLRFRDVVGLEQVCEGVLHNGWKKGKIQITKSSSLGVDGDLAIKLKKSGFKLGVSGTTVMVTEIRIEAAFTPEASRDLDLLVATTAPVDPRRWQPLGELGLRLSGVGFDAETWSAEPPTRDVAAASTTPGRLSGQMLTRKIGRTPVRHRLWQWLNEGWSTSNSRRSSSNSTATAPPCWDDTAGGRRLRSRDAMRSSIASTQPTLLRSTRTRNNDG